VWATVGEATEIELVAFERCRVAAAQAIDEPVPAGPDAVDDVYTDVSLPHPWTRADAPRPLSA
jgi:hypothetical protein